jgi:hypothetical protein
LHTALAFSAPYPPVTGTSVAIDAAGDLTAHYEAGFKYHTNAFTLKT